MRMKSEGRGVIFRRMEVNDTVGASRSDVVYREVVNNSPRLGRGYQKVLMIITIVLIFKDSQGKEGNDFVPS